MSGQKIRAHHDADGISATVLYLKSLGLELEDVEVVFPARFGSYSVNTDVMIDMTPTDPYYDGICIDHHDQHPDEDEREYDLTYSEYPTSVAIYNNMPVSEEEEWKVAVGAVGDASAEEIPGEIFARNSYLMDGYSSVWTKYAGSQMGTNEVKCYKLTSSPINALARIHKEQEALEKLFEADKPQDIIFDKEIKKAKDRVQSEFQGIIKGVGKSGEHKIYEWGNIAFLQYESEFRMTGYLSARLHDEMDKTMVVLDRNSGRGSIRGPLTNYVAYSLRQEDFHVGGHGGACGLSVDEDRYVEFRETLREL